MLITYRALQSADTGAANSNSNSNGGSNAGSSATTTTAGALAAPSMQKLRLARFL